MDHSTSELKHYPDQHIFRLNISENDFAEVNYIVGEDGKFALTHAEVPNQYRGRGIGQVLVEKTFEYLKAHDIPAVAYCSFIRSIARRSDRWRNVIGH
jgi:predicted GNAT family acetyltransferase